ncbi:MAG TPA: transglutaminase-like domain-containing protein [Candidatus Nanoarchaeia archaeon]|nr:transglutaminase-like domain-containing protein [Candidatus Nanoarchaeia archaeon]
MKIIILLFLPLLLAALPATTTTDVTIEGTFKATTTNQGIINAELYYHPPTNEQQRVQEQKTYATPAARITQQATSTYIWQEPITTTYTFGTRQTITNNHYESQLHFITYPAIVPENLRSYTHATEKIDITPAITQQAQTFLTTDDTYLIVHNIANWVKNNINYSLDTLTAQATYPSSWVYENKRGVCDEITNLFISMVRSIGIPARFVTGLVKTNETYSGHGWAEVYYPDQGWVPYDVTFGNYGWIDSKHIIIHEDPDPGTAGITYQWTNNNHVEETTLNIQAITIQEQGEATSPFTISATPLNNHARFGSSVPLIVSITNNENYYHSAQVTVTTAPGIKEDNQQIIALPPRITKNLYWTLTLPENLDTNYRYTAMIEIQDQYEQTTRNTISYEKEAAYTTATEAENYIAQQKQPQEKKPFEKMTITCLPDKDYYYEQQSATITCELNNQGPATTLTTCLLATCKEQALQERQSITITYNLAQAINGRIPYTISNEEHTTVIIIPLNVQPVPYLTITLPNETYDYNKNIALPITYQPNTDIYNFTITTRHFSYTDERIQQQGTIILETNTKQLINGLPLIITYQDHQGKNYQQEDYYTFQIKNLSRWAKIKIWAYNIFH